MSVMNEELQKLAREFTQRNYDKKLHTQEVALQDAALTVINDIENALISRAETGTCDRTVLATKGIYMMLLPHLNEIKERIKPTKVPEPVKEPVKEPMNIPVTQATLTTPAAEEPVSVLAVIGKILTTMLLLTVAVLVILFIGYTFVDLVKSNRAKTIEATETQQKKEEEEAKKNKYISLRIGDDNSGYSLHHVPNPKIYKEAKEAHETYWKTHDAKHWEAMSQATLRMWKDRNNEPSADNR